MSSLVAALLVVIAFLLLATVLTVANATRPISNRLLDRRSEDLDDRAKDFRDYAEQLETAFEAFTDRLVVLATRPDEQIRMVLDALIDDRSRLISAVLAAQNPTAALTVGRIDAAAAQAQAAVQRSMSFRDFLEETAPLRRDTETTDSDGNTIVPVGMGSQ